MAKIRKISSIENGLAEVIKILSEEEIEEAIGKSVSFLRKCSDPDQPQQIDHNDSIKLDLACIKKKKAPPLLNSHEYIMSTLVDNNKINSDDDLDSVLVKFTILHGKLVEVIKKAQDPNSDKGEEISAVEKKEIFESIKSIEDKIMKLKISIDKND
ncbi:hypothetical protein OAS68_00170 [Candidatus Pelagibacter sp.]|jgi:hypothetical protein|nr:hypothetical protein [Candidatus Pelagibacter sp.]